jgi:hypothetical protein
LVFLGLVIMMKRSSSPCCLPCSSTWLLIRSTSRNHIRRRIL